MPQSEKSRRATRLAVTIGPACADVDVLERMIRCGVDVFRLNMSHSNLKDHARDISLIRAAARRVDDPVGILCDLQGPKLRTGANEGGEPFALRRGETVRLLIPSTGRNVAMSRPGTIAIDAPGLDRDLQEGDLLLLSDGRIQIRLLEKRRGGLRARVQRGGVVRERTGVNLPGRALSTHAPTRKDLRDAAFALEQRVDFLALSFVQSPEDMQRLRRFLERRLPHGGAGRQRRMPYLVSKIEKPAALEKLDEILRESDGVLVARGDLGVELPYERVPGLQKRILQGARERGCFSIIATHMLESMVQNPTPTRAEVSDIANAVWDGTDAVLLTAETAIGRYPVETVRVLARVTSTSQSRADFCSPGDAMEAADHGGGAGEVAEAMTRSAAELARRSRARWIVVFTRSGRTANLLARHHPRVPILALTPHEETRRKLTLCYFTSSLLLPRARSVEEMMRRGLLLLRRTHLARGGDRVVLLAGATDPPEASHLLRLVTLGAGGGR